MNPSTLITAILSLFFSADEKGFEGLVIYNYCVGSGKDSLKSVTFFEEIGPKTFFYVGNGNTFKMHGRDATNGWGPLYLQQENRIYWIAPGNDFIPYYEGLYKSHKEQCILLDSTSYVLGYKCNIIRYRDLTEDSVKTKFYYFNDSILPKSQLNSNPEMSMLDKLMNSYPLKIVTVTPGYSTITTTAIEIKRMDTDSIFNKYRSLISSNEYELLNLDSQK